jgi:hypothetical protein
MPYREIGGPLPGAEINACQNGRAPACNYKGLLLSKVRPETCSGVIGSETARRNVPRHRRYHGPEPGR